MRGRKGERYRTPAPARMRREPRPRQGRARRYGRTTAGEACREERKEAPNYRGHLPARSILQNNPRVGRAREAGFLFRRQARASERPLARHVRKRQVRAAKRETCRWGLPTAQRYLQDAGWGKASRRAKFR